MSKGTVGREGNRAPTAGGGIAKRGWSARDVIRRITGRKQAEEALRESEERLQAMFEAAVEGIVIHEKGEIMDANPAFERMFGYSLSELKEMSGFDMVTEASREPTRQKIESGVEAYEAVGRRKDGTTFDIEVVAKPHTYKGRPVRVAAVRDITERKRAEEALQEGEERLRLLMDSTGEAIFGQDLHGACTFCNPACLRLLGYDAPADLLGKNMHDVIHHTRHDGTPYSVEECNVHQALHQGEGVHIDDEVLWRADGTSFPAEYWSYPVTSGDEVIGVVMTFVDITERKRAEEALRHRTHDLGERVKELNCLYGIARLVEKPGISMAEIVQGTVDLIAPGWQYPGVTCARIILEGQESRTENFSETPWRQTADITLHGEPVGTVETCYLEERPESDEGPFLKEERSLVNAIAQRLGEAMERKRADEALRESEKRYRELVEDINDVIYEVDAAGRLTYVSPVVAEVGGHSPSEMIGRSFTDFLHPDDVSRAMESHQRGISGDPQPDELRFLSKSGEVHWMRSFGRPILEGDRIVGFRGVLTDITERKRAEEALEKTRDELEGKVEHQMLRRYPYGLTFRELTILHLVTAGQSDKEMGTTLGISPLTAQKHISNIMAKMEAASRTEAGVRAVREGLLD